MFLERSNRTLLHIINKPIFINGDGNWVGILNDAVITYNNNNHSKINMTTVDAQIILIKFDTHSILKLLNLHIKSVILLGMLTNVTFSLKVTLLIGIENCLKLMMF